MDRLKKELERKKRALEQAKIGAAAVVKNTDGGGTASRFLNSSQLRRLQEQEEDRLKTSGKRPRNVIEGGLQQPSKSTDAKSGDFSVFPSKGTAQLSADSKTETQDLDNASAGIASSKDESTVEASGGSSLAFSGLSSSEMTHRLRSMGLPVRLFGEGSDDAARWKRLQAALEQQHVTLATMSEKEEFRLGKGHGGRNPFLPQKIGAVGESDGTAVTGAAAASRVAAAPATSDDEDNVVGEDENLENDPHKRIFKYLNNLLQQWQEELAQRPESVKQSVAGKNETKTLLQCQDYIRPLFKLLKKRKLEEGLTQHLVKIVHYCQIGEFVQANDAYLDVAIGRAAWPIGVTMVGIHARTGRAKIESANVAHVMNSELQRKYLTSVKRLITYAQRKSDADPSKKVMN